MQSDIRVLSIEPYFYDERCRVPLKFGAVVMDAVSYCEVKATVETRRGERAEGWGGIFLSDVWAWPNPSVSHQDKDGVMRRLAQAYCRLLGEQSEYRHPIDHFFELEPALSRWCREASAGLAEPMPYLGGLVCACPADAALHDAFGNANRISSYQGYGPEFMASDLSRYLGPGFQGRYIAQYLRPRYSPTLPVFHLVGGLDKLRRSELGPDDPQDGLPNSLEEWVERDGLTCLKVKLRGNDLGWDVERTLEVARVGAEAQARIGKCELYFSADTNEICDTPDYVIELLQRIRQRSEETFSRILYVEQPTERDLRAHRHDMKALAKIKPVLVDESLTSLEDFELAMELGWSGIALKSCKCQSAELVLMSKAEQMGIPYSVQDLTNPALALIHSVGLAARIRPMMGVEANSCQFFPQTSQREEQIHPGIFRRRDGQVTTESLGALGLGYRMEEMPARGQ